MRDRGAREQAERAVVVDFAIDDHAAVAVGRVLAEADVRHHDQAGVGSLERADRLLDDAVVRVCLAALFVLGGGQTEQQHGRHTELAQLLRLAGQPIEREVVLAGHRWDLFAHVLSMRDEQRIDEVVRPERRFPHKPAQPFAATQAAEALDR